MAEIGGDPAGSQRRARSTTSRFLALWRLGQYIRPWRVKVATSFLAALLGVAASTVVPLVIEVIVNGPIKRGDSGELVPLFFAVVGLGILEAGFIVVRRELQWAAVLTV
ncbi:MAG TPA: hypothetical protein VHE57_12020, partial [Mycobacteriales bacterium]|nr:hypothetical protein [Mycobacteriales bacterium]